MTFADRHILGELLRFARGSAMDLWQSFAMLAVHPSVNDSKKGICRVLRVVDRHSEVSS